MRKALLAVLAFSLGAAWAAPAGRQNDILVQRLARLYEASRYFELRDTLETLKNDPSIDVAFFRGAVDQVFNRLDSAVSRLQDYIAEIGRASW